jgi:hypothetical protein
MNWLARLLFYFLTITLHPLLAIMSLWLFFYSYNPYAFGGNDWNNQTFSTISIRLFVGTAFLPAIAILLIQRLGLIDNLKMKGIKERIVPLTIACFFYFWIYLNIGENEGFPDYFQQTILGISLTLLLSFFTSILTGINLFAASAISLILAVISSDVSPHRFFLFAKGQIVMEAYWLIMGLVLITGFYLSFRLYVKQNTIQETMLGVEVGFGGHFLAALVL